MRSFIDRFLERKDEGRRSLDFINHRDLLAAHESSGIVFGKLSELRVIQRDEGAAVIIGDTASERRLAGLAWPDDGYNTGICQRCANLRLGMPRYKFSRTYIVQFGLNGRLFRNVTPSNSEYKPEPSMPSYRLRGTVSLYLSPAWVRYTRHPKRTLHDPKHWNRHVER